MLLSAFLSSRFYKQVLHLLLCLKVWKSLTVSEELNADIYYEPLLFSDSDAGLSFDIC